MPFIDTSKLEVKEPVAGWKGRYVHSDNMTLAFYTFAAGASIYEHSHPNDEVWNVIEGSLEVTIDGETVVAGPGFAAVVPPGRKHSVRARTDGRAIVVDYPRRTWIGGVNIG